MEDADLRLAKHSMLEIHRTFWAAGQAPNLATAEREVKTCRSHASVLKFDRMGCAGELLEPSPIDVTAYV